MRSVLRLFDHAFGVRRSCSEARSLGGGCGVLGLSVGWPCSPLSRLISLRKRWISAWAARRAALTSSSRLSSCLTSSRACSSAMLCRSRSSSIVPLPPAERHDVYCVPVSTYTKTFLYPTLEFAQCRMLWDDDLLRHGSRHKNGLRADAPEAGVQRRCDSSKG